MSDVLRHPEEELSALLDGELEPGEAARIHAHIVACAECSAELAAVRLARASVRSLPAVEPPPGFMEGLLAGGLPDEVDASQPGRLLPFRSRRSAVGQAAAAVAAGLLLVVGSGSDAATAVTPQVSGVVEQHAASVTSVSLGSGTGAAGATVPAPGHRLPRPYLAPEELAGYRLVGVFRAPDGFQLLYRKGPYGLSVFQQQGDVDLDRLPEGGDRLDVGGDDAWGWQGRVLVFGRGALVLTLVGDESGDALEAAAEALPGAPGRSTSWATRLKRGCSEALDMLSPAG